jgi:hypothetical protein
MISQRHKRMKTEGSMSSVITRKRKHVTAGCGSNKGWERERWEPGGEGKGRKCEDDLQRRSEERTRRGRGEDEGHGGRARARGRVRARARGAEEQSQSKNKRGRAGTRGKT